MKILAIETSCDETAISVVEGAGEFDQPRFTVLSHLVSSQTKIHEPFGGVVPNLAKREHARNIIPLIREALIQSSLLKKSDKKLITPEKERELKQTLEREPETYSALLELVSNHQPPEITAIAVTHGPGLEPALWVGVNTARALSLAWEIPITPVDHMEGHFLSPLSGGEEIVFPALGLLISGGHTELVLSRCWLAYEKIGQTRDDAVGEAFDKVARILELPYPGGPEISKLAAQASGQVNFELPRPMIKSPDLDFSFSGLKTAVLYLVQKNPEINRAEVAREFQQAVIDVLLAKTARAIEQHKPKTVIIAGGVSGNIELQKQFQERLGKDFPDISLLIPEQKLTTDNATMIAIAGYFHALKKEFKSDISADGNLAL
ncbi:tRNA (adenosine(37)-N6)-threonylcarbamoyltransferase complex transferase subunit TsaD [Candidatus Nomurabacteria bacterium]|nr:tRNA (adenosine(37)-N6)-threonylcarbamoyltransferase complex transferase subunit TsaD [Candidatus Nomurabacteria bacterium]